MDRRGLVRLTEDVARFLEPSHSWEVIRQERRGVLRFASEASAGEEPMLRHQELSLYRKDVLANTPP